jgi:hypothetical protein
LKRPVITAARIITDKKGQRSQPNKKQETRNKAKKNHKIMSRCVESLKGPPDRMGFPLGELQRPVEKFVVNSVFSNLASTELSTIK